MSEQQEVFYQHLADWLKNPETLEKVKATFDEHWDALILLPASKSGRYHHVTENYEPYGLLNHTLRVVWVARHLVIEECGHRLDESMMERVTVAALFHDFGKMKQSAPNHGVYALPMLKRFDGPIKMLVKTHMHKWSPYPCSGIEDRIVAYADYIASRPEFEINGVLVFKGPEQ